MPSQNEKYETNLRNSPNLNSTMRLRAKKTNLRTISQGQRAGKGVEMRNNSDHSNVAPDAAN